MQAIGILRFSRRRMFSNVLHSTAHRRLYQDRRRTIMRVPSVVHDDCTGPSQDLSTLTRIDIGATGAPAAANDDQGEAPAEYRPNPLWVVNAALAAFLFVAALLIAGA
jgi:hypothetical protein